MTKPIYRGHMDDRRVTVVQSDPQCRTILFGRYAKDEDKVRVFIRSKHFVSVPYMIFVIVQDHSLAFDFLAVFFHDRPLLSTSTPLSLTCFPNCYLRGTMNVLHGARLPASGIVCLGPEFRIPVDDEHRMIEATLESFWTSIFTDAMGYRLRIRCLERRDLPRTPVVGPVGEPPASDAAPWGIEMLATATSHDPRVGVKIDWLEETRGWLDSTNELPCLDTFCSNWARAD